MGAPDLPARRSGCLLLLAVMALTAAALYLAAKGFAS